MSGELALRLAFSDLWLPAVLVSACKFLQAPDVALVA